jgi:integrase
MILALTSGAREGELLRLTCEQILIEPQEYDPKSGKTRPGVSRTTARDTKNGDDRVLYFPGETTECLRSLTANRPPSEYLFVDPEQPDVEPVFPADAWRYAKKKARIKNLRFHDLRHVWACHLLESGATIPQLMVLGGWRSVAAMRVYIV